MRAANVGDVWERQAVRHGPRKLLVDDQTGEILSYEELNRRINQAANLLLSRGVRKGDVIVLVLSNIPEFFVLFYAALKVGAVAMPVDYTLTADGLDAILAKAKPALAFVEERFLSEFLKTRGGCPFMLLRARAAGEASFEAACRRGQERFHCPWPVGWQDAAWITFSSGSTGRPKLILHAQEHFLKQWELMTEGLEFEDGEGFLCTQQLHYYDHIIYFGVPLFNGGFLVLTPRFSRSKFWELLARHRVQYANLFPVMQRILMNPPEDVRGRDLRCVKGFMSVGEVLRVDQQLAFEEAFGCLLADGYAANDFGWVSHNVFARERRKLGSVGRILGDAQVRIVDERGAQAKAGQVGEILVGPPTCLKEYFNSPELNAERIHDGWLGTRDLGRFDEAGWLFVCGRLDSVINVAGKKVFPSELEGFIERLAGVRACAVAAVPDPILGQRAKAFVVPREGQALSPKDVESACQAGLPKEKWPSVQVVGEIPIGPTGKFDYKKLLEIYS